VSLLSNPQATPERVFAVIELVHELGGTATSGQVLGWMQPTGSKAESAIKATLTVAVDLRLLSLDGDRYHVVGAPLSWKSYADTVHHALATVEQHDADALLFEVLAWMVALDARQLAETTSGCTAATCAGKISDGLPGGFADDARRFNPTKLTPWVRWMEFLGVGLDGGDQCHFIPFLADRMARELAALIVPGEDRAIGSVYPSLLARMPYLDHGPVFARVDPNRAHRGPKELGDVSSRSWLELHVRRAIVVTTVGDSTHQMPLSTEIRGVSPFAAISNVRLSTGG
jgi:hypothetical protein